MRRPHHPKIVKYPDRMWVVECPECRRDMTSEVPIGIGLPLPDRLTAERLAENHRGRLGSRVGPVTVPPGYERGSV